MNKTHTPGPWRTGDMFNTVFGPKTDQPCPEVIATVNKGNKANALLIAAAPELLEVAHLVQGWLEEAGFHVAEIHGKTAFEILKQVRTVIDEVEGRA